MLHTLIALQDSRQRIFGNFASSGLQPGPGLLAARNQLMKCLVFQNVSLRKFGVKRQRVKFYVAGS